MGATKAVQRLVVAMHLFPSGELARSLVPTAVTEAVSGELADGRVQRAEMVAMAIAAESQYAKCGPTIFFSMFFKGIFVYSRSGDHRQNDVKKKKQKSGDHP
jgi:hypothetical protein